jgi:hypothetical protein
MKRKRIIGVVVLLLLLLGGLITLLWTGLVWPPPGLILKYGLPPQGGLTGRTRSIAGVEFLEISPGYLWIDTHGSRCRKGDLPGRILRPLGFQVGTPSRHYCRRYWAERPTTLWFSVKPLYYLGPTLDNGAIRGLTLAEIDTLRVFGVIPAKRQRPRLPVMHAVWIPPLEGE